MPEIAAATDWLHREALDHLDDDLFGTYELLWLLRGSSFTLTDEEARAVARAVLAAVIHERQALVVQFEWAVRQRLGDPVDWRTLDDSELFEFTETGEYYALMSPEDL